MYPILFEQDTNRLFKKNYLPNLFGECRTSSELEIYTYGVCVYIYIYIHGGVVLATIVKGDPKAPFSIATTPRCRGGRYSLPRIDLL